MTYRRVYLLLKLKKAIYLELLIAKIKYKFTLRNPINFK